eukprot:7952969-Pyramimonas_sp.AAC.1
MAARSSPIRTRKARCSIWPARAALSASAKSVAATASPAKTSAMAFPITSQLGAGDSAAAYDVKWELTNDSTTYSPNPKLD